MNSDKQMNLIIAINESYIPMCKAMLFSFVTNHKDNKINVFLLNSSIKKGKLKELDAFARSLGIKLSVVEVQPETMLHSLKAQSRFSIEMYYRIFAHKLLPEDGELKVVTKAQPTAKQMEDLMLAWKIVKHAKSNGIAIAKDHQSLGIGPGQVNRIWSTQMAIERSGDKVRGAALASDAFFPFDDCVKACAEAGISCIIQPGGSVRDQDSIDACDRYGIAMVFTGMRHFKH